jgi:hypothetical protein
VGTRPEDGADLLSEHRRLGEAPSDGAQTERRIQRVLMPQLMHGEPIQRLVSADVHRADGDGQPFHGMHNGTIRFVLLVLVRKFSVPIHEQELRSEQPDAHGTCVKRRRGIARQFDVGKQFHSLAVQRDRRHVAEAIQSSPLQRALPLPEAVFLQHDG